MKLSELKLQLKDIETLNFILPNGSFVPTHFHVTEIGLITKKFIDCGGTLRDESVINFQLWEANDFDHKLAPRKLLGIIGLSERKLALEDLEIEVEYQADTIGKYGLDFDGTNFLLTQKKTNCLAMDNCGIPVEQLEESDNTNACTPGSGCC